MFVPEALKCSDITVPRIFLANFKVFAGEKVLAAPSQRVPPHPRIFFCQRDTYDTPVALRLQYIQQPQILYNNN